MGLLYKTLLLLVILILLGALGICVWLFVYTGNLPDIEHLSQFAPATKTLVGDSCLASLSMAVPFERIGEPLRHALAAAEPRATISDQIAWSLMCDHRRSPGRYALDSVRVSWHLRRRFTEQQLFTIYANRVYFGDGATGVQIVARNLFLKTAETLSPDEAALIAGLIRAPNALSPYRFPERAMERRNQVLDKMAAQGSLSADEAMKAKAAPLGLVTLKLQKAE
jgi:membrane carboxypeptidase/penicillin-binding protein